MRTWPFQRIRQGDILHPSLLPNDKADSTPGALRRSPWQSARGRRHSFGTAARAQQVPVERMPPGAGTQLRMCAFPGRRLTAVISSLGKAAAGSLLMSGRCAVNMLRLFFFSLPAPVLSVLFLRFFPFDGWVDVSLRDEHHRGADTLRRGVSLSSFL